MILDNSGKKLRRQVGFIAGFIAVQEGKFDTDAISFLVVGDGTADPCSPESEPRDAARLALERSA